MLEQVGTPPHSVNGLYRLYVQQGVDLDFQAPPPVAGDVLQVFPLLGGLYDVGLLVLELVEALELEYPAVLLRLRRGLVVPAHLHFAEHETPVDDGVAGAQYRFLDVGPLHLVVPPDDVLLALVVHVDHLLPVVVDLLGVEVHVSPQDQLLLIGGTLCCGGGASTAEPQEVTLAAAALVADGGLHGRGCNTLLLLRPLLRDWVELIQRTEGDEVVAGLGRLRVQGLEAGEGVGRFRRLLGRPHQGVKAAECISRIAVPTGVARGARESAEGVRGRALPRRLHRRGALEPVPVVVGEGVPGRRVRVCHGC
mmetsp:Transcript_105685/g.298933  ORF Transcript_105685/g.298933 Transcript_105685/m.298933 type:complete len:309 (+) Transcript_105685:1131-2057(+)